jgi:hypothetical protein
VKSELQDGQLQFSDSDRGVGLPMEDGSNLFCVLYHQRFPTPGLQDSGSRPSIAKIRNVYVTTQTRNLRLRL